MQDSTVNAVVDHLHEQFPADRSYSKQQLDGASEMPAPIAHYIIQQLDRRITEHLERIAADAWIDHTDRSVRQSLDQLETSLAGAISIPADNWSQVVSDATRELFAYLVNPVGELTDFVFRERSSLPTAHVRRRMSYFSPYSYLHSVFTAFAERKSLKTIDRGRFEEILDRIDRQMIADYTIDKWERLFEPLFELVDPLTPQGEETRAAADHIRQLAANKQFEALVRQLDRANRPRIGRDDLHDFLAAALDRPAAASSSGRSQSPEPRQDADGPQPRWKQFQQGSKQQSPGAAPSPRSRPETPRKPSGDTGQPLWQQFQHTGKPSANQPSADTAAAPSPPSSTRDPQHSAPEPPSESLETLERKVIGTVPDDQRERFVRRLFSGSTSEYADILAELHKLNSWEQASSLIAKKVFLPHQVNIYSEPAVTFTDLVEARFRRASVR